MIRKYLVAAALALSCGLAFGQAHIIQCDPNATGSASYPNVKCASDGTLAVSGSVTSTPSGNQNVTVTAALPAGTNAIGTVTAVGATAVGAAPATNPVYFAGTDGTNIRGIHTDSTGNVLVSTASNLGINVRASMGTLTDCSGTITTGGTAQTAVATNASRRYLLIHNVSANDLFINFTSAATTSTSAGGSIKIPTGATFIQENNFVSTELISIIGGTTAQAYTCKQG